MDNSNNCCIHIFLTRGPCPYCARTREKLYMRKLTFINYNNQYIDYRYIKLKVKK